MRLALLLTAVLAPATAHAATPQAALRDMVTAWRSLSSYRAVQNIQERVDGELLEEQRTRVAFRKPWEIQITWETVHPGRKAYWSETRRDGEVLIYPGGLTGRALGILSFSPDNPILKRDTRHTLAEGGFGFLAEQIGTYFGTAHAEALAMLPSAEGTWTIAVSDGRALGYGRAELTVSQATHLPVAFSGWDAEGALVERFSWTDVELDAKIDPKVDFDVAYR